MATKHCSHGTCTSDSRYGYKPHMQEVTFFSFPKNLAKCARWVNACSRQDFTVEKVTRFKYICSRHFYMGKGPTIEHPDPISARASSEKLAKFLQGRRSLKYSEKPATVPARLQMETETELVVDDLSPPPKRPKTYARSDNIVACGSSDFGLEDQPPPDIPNQEEEGLNEYLLFESPKKTASISSNVQTPSLFQGLTCINMSLPFLASVMDKGWLIGRCEKIMEFHRKEGIVRSVHVEVLTGLFTVKVHGKNVSCSQINNIPAYVTSEVSLGELLKAIEDVKLCSGVAESSNLNCLVVASAGCQWCSHCLKARKLRLNNMSRQKKAPRKVTKLPKEQLISLVKDQRYKARLLNKKLDRIREKFTATLQSGHELCNNDNSLFAGILEKRVSALAEASPLRIMLEEQLKACKLPDKHGMRWRPEILKWAAYVRHKSTTAYDTIASSGFLHLPSATTIGRQFVNFRHEPGIHSNIIEDMLKEAKLHELPLHQRYVALVLDEMKIRSSIIYNKHTGKLVGFTELSLTEDDALSCKLNQSTIPEVASHMLAFFVRGLTSAFKYAFAHFPTHKLTASKLYKHVWKAVDLLEDAGFKVLVVVADGAAVNRKLIKMCTTKEVPYKCDNIFALDGRPLFFICDVPHLLKTTRNCLYNSRTDWARLMRRNGKELTWSHVLKVFNSSLGTTWRGAWRITKDHVILNSFSTMKVRLAAQVLSATFAAVMEHELGDIASETINLLRLMNKWFDCLNISNTISHIKKRNADLMPFYSKDDARLQWLSHEFLSYFQSWKTDVDLLPNFTKEEKSRMFISQETYEGHYITVHSICEVVPFLLDSGAKYVLTSHLNQDILEQEFGRQRNVGGSNENPTVQAFCQNAMKLNATRAYCRARKGGNTFAA